MSDRLSDTDNCKRCKGEREITETTTERDTTMGIIMGTALGMGYFPASRTVTKRITCPVCKGTGLRA